MAIKFKRSDMLSHIKYYFYLLRGKTLEDLSKSEQVYQKGYDMINEDLDVINIV